MSLVSICVGILVAVVADAQFIEPQATALVQLRAASAVPVEAHWQEGAPRLLQLDVSIAGATPIAAARSFLADYGALFDQSDPELTLEPVSVDADEQDIVLFRQRFRGIPVFGGRVTVGVSISPLGEQPRIRFAAGWLLPTRTGLEALDTIPAITPATAENAARSAQGRPGASVLGETALLLFDPAALGEAPAPRLVWRVTLGSGDPVQLLVDAHTSAIAFQHALSETGNGLDDYDADFEDANGGTMGSTNCFNPTTIDDTAGDEYGLISQYVSDPEIGALWWHARETYLDYHDKVGRHSWDDDDGELVVYSHIGGSPNARFDPSCDEFEFHDVYVANDVLAHEFTHGVISSSVSDLVYSGESGALNEAFADAMAALVVDDDDWAMGENLLNGGGPIRSLADPLNGACKSVPAGVPGKCNDPDRWSLRCRPGNDYCNYASDNNGVHTNSGIQNKATYLMSDGGSFNGRTVVGMGRAKTTDVIYFLTRYLTPDTATFLDARNLAVAAAKVLAQGSIHGFVPANVCTVRNAYAAVELGQADTDCNGVEDNVDDDDQDSIFNDADNCRNTSNPSQQDFDHDGVGDACDADDDADGIPDSVDKCPGLATTWYENQDSDGDGTGRGCDGDNDNDGVPDDGAPGDTPCASGITQGCDDNCVENFNPSQFDGNNNGNGDACDPDADSDGYYVESDNCTFVNNPTQTDTDQDGIGDACDKCPDVPDNMGAYTMPFPELGILPEPLQPDEDGDGIPDACDTYAFGNAGLSRRGTLWNPSESLRPDGVAQALQVVGDAGTTLRLPLDVCDSSAAGDFRSASDFVQLSFSGLTTTVQASVVDDEGRVAGRSERARDVVGAPDRGMRFKPRCDRRWFLELTLGPDFT
ncbi:MAG: M4 family metallopeptidase, partial [Proteobacteria bacterium]|nr:M4 family metallopeptidase [Pseudomonadota bacterium]